jgi:hypothetical protein
MAAAVEKSVLTSVALPRELENFIDESIHSMSEEELRTWKQDSEKIMDDSRSRSGASSAQNGTSR